MPGMGASHPPVGLKVIKSVLSHTALARNSLSLLLGRTRSPAHGADTTDHPVTMLKISKEYSQSVWLEMVKKPDFNISEDGFPAF